MQANALTNEQKIDLLNTLEVVEYDADADGVLYVDVEDTPENRAVLAQVVDGNLDEKFESCAALMTTGHIDISIIGFELADYYDGQQNVWWNEDQSIGA